MSKVKQWAEDTAHEKAVDNIIFKLKDGQIDLTTSLGDNESRKC